MKIAIVGGGIGGLTAAALLHEQGHEIYVFEQQDEVKEIGAGIGIGKIGASAMEAIARQPEAAGDIRSNMIVIAALIEGVALFAVIVCILAYFL